MDNQPVANAKIHPALLVFLIFPIMGIVAAIVIGGQRNPGSALVPPAVGYTPSQKLIGNPAPDFALQSPSGESIRLSSLRGRWVFLNFWATWCPPCRQEMPTFQRFLDGEFGPYAGKATVLAVDTLESADQVKSFLTELKLNIPVGLDSDGAVNRLYAVVQLPMTFVVDPSGVLRYEQIGEMTPDLLKKYLDQMQ